MRRRDFLLLSAGAAVLPLGNPALAAPGAARTQRLVVVLLRGAVDGLNVVVPYADDAYYAARPSIAIAKPDTGDGAGLALDGHFALHPALAPLLPLWQEKQLAFVHAAGSHDPTRSHFDAQLFIENGTPGRRVSADGWMNRLLAALPGTLAPTAALAVGPTLPQIMKGKLPVANLPLGAAAGNQMAIDRPEVAAAFDKLYGTGDASGRAYRQGRTTRAQLVADLPKPAGDGAAPAANDVAVIGERLAGLLSRHRGIRLAFLGLGGWDTHVRQGGASGQLANRLRQLGQGLAAFRHGLGQDWADTVVVVLSEFGRTVHENGDAGTDHGHGNVVWVMGGPVNGGKILGDWPGLAPGRLYQGRDLAVTTDYRSVLAAVVARHLRLPDRALAAIFPDFTPPRTALDRLIA
jgi:uncharacterized protein (DUF1501 family)